MKNLNKIIVGVFITAVIGSCLPPPPRPPRPPKPPRPPRHPHGMLEIKATNKVAIFRINQSIHNI